MASASSTAPDPAPAPARFQELGADSRGIHKFAGRGALQAEARIEGARRRLPHATEDADHHPRHRHPIVHLGVRAQTWTGAMAIAA